MVNCMTLKKKGFICWGENFKITSAYYISITKINKRRNINPHLHPELLQYNVPGPSAFIFL